MATDFTYNEKQIVSSGPFKPSGKDMPVDARTRVESYADIVSIPNPHVGLKITVKVDETNNNKMTDYIVKSLKPNSMGAPDSAINEVVRYVDYLGVSGGGTGEGSSTNLNDYQKKTDNALATTDKTIVGAINEVKSDVDDITVPTKISELNNDSNFVTKTQLEYAINNIDTSNSKTVKTILPNVVFFGDSITDVNTNGEWAKVIENYAEFKSLKNYARGNCRWTFKSDTTYNITATNGANSGENVIWNQFNRLVDDVDNGRVETPDCIIVFAGVNDVFQNADLGDVSTVFNYQNQSTNVTTLTNLAASIRYVCELMMNTYPECQIILATPLQINNYVQVAQIMKVRDIIIESAKIMGLKVIDQTCESGLYCYKEFKNNVHLKDGTHLNEAGGKMIAKFLAREFYNKIVLQYSKSEDTPITYTVTNNLTNVTTSNSSVTISEGTSYSANLSPTENYEIDTVTVTMGDTDVTDSCYSNGVINISSVTGNIVITASAIESLTPITKYSITNNLTNAETNNPATTINENSGYIATITANTGYKIDTVTVTMGGIDVTSSVYTNGNINIASVTGDIVITVTTVRSSEGLTTTNYLRDNLVGNFSGGVNGASIMIPDQLIPAGVIKQVELYTKAPSNIYLIAFEKDGNDKFTPLYFKYASTNAGANTIEINEPIDRDFYFGWKSTNGNSIGQELSPTAASTTGQQYNQYYGTANSTYVPVVGEEGAFTSSILIGNRGFAFDILVQVEH